MESEKNYQLFPFESLISRKILDKLEKQITLAKVASIKANEVGATTSISQPCGLSSSSLLSPTSGITNGTKSLEGKYAMEGDNNIIFLEATLEYTRLKKEFSKMKLESKDGEQISSGSTCHENFSEDLDFILNIIGKTKRSLKDNNSYSVLKEDVLKASLHLNAENQLKDDIKQTKERIEKMKEEIHKREFQMSLEEQEKIGEIGRLKDEQHLIKSEGTETLKFTDLFFEAQSCNTRCSHQNQVEEESKKISQINRKIDRDVHCLAVMESWTDDFCQQLEEKINEWKRRLRGDELVMDMRIDAKRRAIKSQEELIKSLNETIAERLEELAPWEEEKEVERQERLVHMRRYYSVRKIQRWWRAYMVKLKLYKRRKVKPIKV